VSYVIVDLDGTLVLDNDQPNEPLIKHLNDQVMAGDVEIIVVSARKIDRLTETRAWLQEHGVAGVEQVHLNDFEGTAFETGLAFKTYKYGLLLEEYGADEIAYAVDNDDAVRAMAAELGIRAFSPEQALAISATPPADDAPDSADTIEESTQLEENAMAREHETRALPLGDFTVTEGEDGQKTFTGYAAVFGAESQGLPFIERIANGAFARAIKQAAQGRRVIKFLHGHDESRMLATTASGRLTLTEDNVGLKVEARLDPADPDAAAVISKLTNEAKAMGMSFGFTVPKNGQEWHEDGSRTLTEIGLLEVSTLSGHTPAYPATLGLTAVRKIAPNKIGVDGDALLETLEAVKAGNTLDADQTALLDAVRSKLGAAPEPVIEATVPMGEHHTIVAARLKLEQLKG
jgi:HK97 family phage prohead protease